MCGIIGYYCDSPTINHYTMIQSIFHASKIRGLHAFGFCYYDKEGKIVTVKRLKIGEILDDISYMKEQDILPKMFIGHCRYTTCEGDWDIMENNQPTVAWRIAHAFNGVISMKPKAEYEEEFGENYTTANDGEIFMKHLFQGGTPSEFFVGNPYSYAGVWLKDSQMYCYRNDSRPLWVYRHNKGTFIASTSDIFRRAVGARAKAWPIVSNKVFTPKSIEIMASGLTYGRKIGSRRSVYATKV